MNMVPSLSAMEARIVVAKNAIAIIVVYFLIVSTFVLFLTAKIGAILGACKFFPHFLHKT
jgi:hypothetical protein